MTQPVNLTLILQELAAICLQKSYKIVTAESCTGGGVAYEITALPDSSQWFECGFVTYSNAAKMTLLGVPAETITEFGAVSVEVATKMAQGALHHSAATLALSITGIAGPTGGSSIKPVGYCCFGWASTFFADCWQVQQFKGNRTEIRSQAILFSLQYLLYLIKNKLISLN